MNAVDLQLMEEKYLAKLQELEVASRQIATILEHIIENQVVDRAISAQGIGPECGISLAAGGMLDASHFSMALHAFYAAKIQNIQLNLPVDPPKNLDEVGGFYFKAFLIDLASIPIFPAARDLAYLKRIIKRRVVNFGKQLFFRTLNIFVRLFAISRPKIVIYGTLYNVQPRLSSLSNVFNVIKKSLRGNLFAIEYSNFYQLMRDSTSDRSLELRRILRDSLLNELGVKFPHLRSEVADLSYFLAGTIPISNLEGRNKNFQMATHFSKSLNPKAVVSCNGFAGEMHTSFLAAACKQLCNSTIIGIQHGGYYGYSRNHGQAFNTEYQFLDYFLSWGWDKKESVLGHFRTKMLPIGSFHLRDLSLTKTRSSGGQDGSNGSPKILFIAGPYLYTYPRCEQQVGRELIDNYLLPTNSIEIARFARQIGGKLFLKGGYVKEVEDHYFRQIAIRSNELGVRCQQIDSKLRAYDIYTNYDLIVFDSIGTGFFESIAMNVPTMLLASARKMPLREARDTLSELFFTDTFQSADKYWSVFQEAKTASVDFLSRFGKSSNSDILDIITNTEEFNHKRGTSGERIKGGSAKCV
jgi:hypothetical protein